MALYSTTTRQFVHANLKQTLLKVLRFEYCNDEQCPVTDLFSLDACISLYI
jgi:hypothetical protein